MTKVRPTLALVIPFSLLISASSLIPAPAAPFYQCTFADADWKPADWIVVKSPRWEHFGKWVQRDGFIQNETPEGATKEELHGKRAQECYSSMVLKEKVKGNFVAKSTMEFADKYAPLIVLAPELGESKDGAPEFREHWEVVIYDAGVNVWRHLFVDGKPSWKKAAFWKFELKPNTRYVLEVARKGKQLTVTVDGHAMGYLDDSLPDELHLGLTGCEGINRFYDFAVEQ